MQTIGLVLIGLVAIKALTIGSDFSFYNLFKHGRKYWRWYTKRQTFKDYLQG